MSIFDKKPSGFDRVELQAENGVQEYSRSEWEALPLDQRVAAIIHRRARSLRFFRGDTEVTMKEALEDR